MSEAHGHSEPHQNGEFAGALRADTPIVEVLAQAITSHLSGGGNAIESTFLAKTNAGDFSVHFHLCIRPVQPPTVN